MTPLFNRLAKPALAIALAAGLLPATALAAPALKGAVALDRDVVSVERLEDVPTPDEMADIASVGLDDMQVLYDVDGSPYLIPKQTPMPADGDATALATLPRQFDLRAADLDGDGVPENYVSKVKNQGRLGTCWAFAATAAAETSIMSEAGTPVTDGEELDLSEHHLAWFSHKALPEEGAPANQGGEGLHNNAADPLSAGMLHKGGFSSFATALYGSFIGPVPESVAPYVNREGVYWPRIEDNPDAAQPASDGDWSLDEDLRFAEYDDYELEASYILPLLSDINVGPVGSEQDAAALAADSDPDPDDWPGFEPSYNEVTLAAYKEQLWAGRAIEISVNILGPMEPTNFALYNPTGSGPEGGNHAVCIVGWDDDYPASNFLEESQPPGDGAFIVKNSWGSMDSTPGNRGTWGVGDSGYFYLSYYDRTLVSAEALDFVTDADEDVSRGPEESTTIYHHQYNYLPASGYNYNLDERPMSYANVYPFDETSVVETVGLTTAANPDGQIDIYLLDEEASSPTDGTLVATKSFARKFGGFQRVELDDPIIVDAGRSLGVVVTNGKPGSGYSINTPTAMSKVYEETHNDDDGATLIWGEGRVNPGESYFGAPSTTTTFNDGTSVFSDYQWQDLSMARQKDLEEGQRQLEEADVDALNRAVHEAFNAWADSNPLDPEAVKAAEARLDAAKQRRSEALTGINQAVWVEVDNYPITVYAYDFDPENPPVAERVEMARLYNPATGEHLYTSDAREKAVLLADHWNDEGLGWTAPVRSEHPVWRLYNPETGEHLYTYDANERAVLSGREWNDEGVAFYSDALHGTEVYRVYNESLPAIASHHYPTNPVERDRLARQGWRDEDVAWYGA